MFVDGDDYLDLDSVEILVELSEKYNLDIVMFPYKKEYVRKSIQVKLFDKSESKICHRDISKKIFSYLIGPGSEYKKFNPLAMDKLNTAWGKMYRKSCIEGISFLDTKIIGTEDGLYNIMAFISAMRDVYYTERVWYHYEKSNSSSLLHSYKNNYFYKRQNFYCIVDKILKEKNLSIYSVNLNNRIVLELFSILVNLMNKNSSIFEKEIILKKEMNKFKYKDNLVKFSYGILPFFWKIYFILLKHNAYKTVLYMMLIMIKIKRFKEHMNE